MLRVSLTGGIGSGKSTVAKIFSLLNVPIYYADNRAKQLMVENLNLMAGIKAEFGEEAYLPSGLVNRKYLSKKVFTNKAELQKLNKLVHPTVFEDQKAWFSAQQAVYAIAESALIFEVNRERHYEKVIVVHAEDKKRIERVMKRDNADEAIVADRVNNQLPQDVKMEKADFLIDNNGDKSLIQQVMDIHTALSGTSEANSPNP